MICRANVANGRTPMPAIGKKLEGRNVLPLLADSGSLAQRPNCSSAMIQQAVCPLLTVPNRLSRRAEIRTLPAGVIESPHPFGWRPPNPPLAGACAQILWPLATNRSGRMPPKRRMGGTVRPFGVTYCTVDGELVGHWEMAASRLSTKWLAYCGEILAAGPLVAMNLHGPLAAWRVECVPGRCHFSIGGQQLFSCVILPAESEAQNAQVLAVLSSPEWKAVLEHLPAKRPQLLVVSLLSDGVSDENREAMLEFVHHFAAAYFQWFESAEMPQ